MANIPYVVSGGTLTIYLDKPVSLTSEHPNFKAILERLKAQEDPEPLLDPDRALRDYFGFLPDPGDAGYSRLSRAYMQAVMDAGYPRMREVVEEIRQTNHSCSPVALSWPAASFGFVAQRSSYNEEQRVIIVGNRFVRTPRPHLVDDAVVFEQILRLEEGPGLTFHIVTNYRTLVVPKLMLLALPLDDYIIENGGRYVKAPGVEFSIDYFRQQAREIIR